MVGAILLVSWLLRIMGIFRELPHVYQHDEINTVMIALQYGTGNFSPPQFLHGSLTSYLLFLVFAGQYGVYHLLGLWTSGDDVVHQFIQDPTPFYVLGRFVMVCLGTLIVWTTYRVGVQLHDRLTGLLASALVGMSVLHVNMSQVIKEDVVASAILSVTFLMVARMFTHIEQGVRRSAVEYGVVAFGIGMAMAAKYYSIAAIVWVPMLLLAEWVHVWVRASPGPWTTPKCWREAAKRLAGAGVGTLLGFSVGSPYAVLQGGGFLHDLWRLRVGYQTIMPNVDGLSSFHLYFFRYLPDAVGGPIALAAFVGMLLVVRRRWRWRVLLLSAFPIAFLCVLLKIGAAFPHFLTPIIPFVALLAARLFRGMVDWMVVSLPWASTSLRGSSPLIACLLGLVSALPTLSSTVRYEIYAVAPDTRTLAKRWIEANVPVHERIAVEGAVQEVMTYGPPLEANGQTLEAELTQIRHKGGYGRLWQARIRDATHSPHKQFALCKAMELTPADLERCRPTFLVVVTDTSDRGWFILAHDRRQFLQEVQQRYELVKQFDPYPGIRYFPSEWSLRDEFSRLRMVGIFSHPVPLVTGPRIRVFRQRDGFSTTQKAA